MIGYNKQNLLFLFIILISQLVKCPVEYGLNYPLFLESILGGKDNETLSKIIVKAGSCKAFNIEGQLARCQTDLESLKDSLKPLLRFLSKQSKNRDFHGLKHATGELIIAKYYELKTTQPSFNSEYLIDRNKVDVKVILDRQIVNLPMAMLCSIVEFLPTLFFQIGEGQALVEQDPTAPLLFNTKITLLQFKEFISLFFQVFPILFELRKTIEDIAEEKYQQRVHWPENPLSGISFLKEVAKRLTLNIYTQVPPVESVS